MKGKCSTHLVNVLETSNSSTSDPDYYNEHGDPVYAHMVNVQDNKCKRLIQFPISTELEKVRNSVKSSTSNGKCPTVLLKADTSADVNLMNSRTFDTLFNRDRTILQRSSLRMEAYGNSAVEVLRKFHAFLTWKGRMQRQLFYITSMNNSPNLLSRDGCYTLCVIKPCYSVELTVNSKEIQRWHPHSLQLPWRKQSCMLVHLFIVEIKELKWLNGLIPKKQHQEGTFNTEKAANLPWPKGLKWSTRGKTLLHTEYWGNTWKNSTVWRGLLLLTLTRGTGWWNYIQIQGNWWPWF